jgi:hypothetical protein
MRFALLVLMSGAALAQYQPPGGGGTPGPPGPPSPYYIYPETFGAVGDNSHDDTAAINSAIASALSAGVCSNTITCIIQFQAKTYKTTATLTLAGSYVHLVGMGMSGGGGSTIINSTATTGDLLDITGTGANCAAGSAFWNSVENMTFTRVTAATAGHGINITDACWTTLREVQVTDSWSNIYVNGSADTVFQDTQASFTTSSASTRSNYELDSSSNPNNSTYFRRSAADGSGGGAVTGLYIHGACIADVFATDFSSSNGKYGVVITSTYTSSPLSGCNGDVHLVNPILDNPTTAGVQVNNVYSGGLPAVDINGGYVNGGNSGEIGVDIENSAGVNVRGMQLRLSTSGIGVKIAGSNSSADVIQGNILQVTATGVSINGSGSHVIIGNTCSGISGNAVTTCFAFVNSSNNVVRSNSASGTYTTALSFDSSSGSNQADGNNWAFSAVSDSGTGNTLGLLTSGSQALGTSSISANTCASTVTISVSNLKATDRLEWVPSADISGQTGYSYTSTDGLKIYSWMGTGSINFHVCNGTGSPITPGAVTLNYWAFR